MEANLKQVYQVLASGINPNDSTQNDALLSVARQCPRTGGKAVQVVRDLWLNFNPNSLIDGITECENILIEAPLDTLLLKQTSVVSSSEENQISLYPNPASDLLTVHFGTTTQAHIQVMDMKGVVIYQAESQSESTEINLSDWNEGVYLFRVKANGIEKTQKITVIH